jgi:hypothetical protein
MRLLLFALLLLPFFAAAQTINPALVRSYWPARWIAHPTTPGKQYGVFHFRKTVELEKKPGTYVIHVSADNRYRLYVNGSLVCEGPARSDTQHCAGTKHVVYSPTFPISRSSANMPISGGY